MSRVTKGNRASGRPWVVKIGGRLCEDHGSRVQLARACAALDAPLVLVHGGGDAVTRLLERLGVEPHFVEGRRVTTAEDLNVVEGVLSGEVNKGLVRALADAGRPAAGVSGCDGGLVRCALAPGLGRVGVPEAIDPRLLHALLLAGWTPVVSPVSLGPDGAPVNVNADECATALARSLGAARLFLLSDVEGVRVDDAWQDEIAGDAVEDLIASGQVTRGMIPKLRSAAAATSAGVGEVRIAGYVGGALESVAGTRVVAQTLHPQEGR